MRPRFPLFPSTGVGSLPHVDPEKAVETVLRHCGEVPFWPQLPARSWLETMYPQCSSGLPASSIEGERLIVEGGEAMMAEAESFYERFLSGDSGSFAIPVERAAGLHRLLSVARGPFVAAKGQVTGPVSFGLLVTDREKRPLFYDPVGRDVLVKHLLRVAQWQVSRLKALSQNVILVVDEPYLASVGSAILSLSRDDVASVLDEIFDGLPGAICGVHCCANTDWGLVLSTRVGYLSFDAYEYADSLILYPAEVKAFIERGGILAFGIVPTSPEAIARESAGSLAERIEEIFGRLEARGIPKKMVEESAFLTAACGLGTIPEPDAERAMRLASELSSLLRARRGGAPA